MVGESDVPRCSSTFHCPSSSHTITYAQSQTLCTKKKKKGGVGEEKERIRERCEQHCFTRSISGAVLHGVQTPNAMRSSPSSHHGPSSRRGQHLRTVSLVRLAPVWHGVRTPPMQYPTQMALQPKKQTTKSGVNDNNQTIDCNCVMVGSSSQIVDLYPLLRSHRYSGSDHNLTDLVSLRVRNHSTKCV